MDSKQTVKFSAVALLTVTIVGAVNGEILRLSCKIFADFSVVSSDKFLAASYHSINANVEMCKSHCIMDTQCKSINVNEDEGICQLNNKSDQDSKDNIQTTVKDNWTYFSTKYNETSVGYNCRSFGKCSSGLKCLDTCSCPGYQCVDIDECAVGTHNCHIYATCSNSFSSFSCKCKLGHVGNGTLCTDSDECLMGSHNCSTRAECINLKGSYNCSCRTGYEGDGKRCNDINECTKNGDACGEDKICQNSVGSFLCLRKNFVGNTSVWLGIDNVAFNIREGQYSSASDAYSSNKVIDGNMTTCIVTMKMPNPWWMVALRREFAITGVVVLFSQIHPGITYNILVGNYNASGGVGNLPCATNASLQHSQLQVLSCPRTMYGRYVTVMATKESRLWLCEVEIYEANIAYKRRNTKSKLLTIDGSPLVSSENKLTMYYSPSDLLMSTVKSWWRVFLDRKALVDLVVIQVGQYWQNSVALNISVDDPFLRESHLCTAGETFGSNETRTLQCLKPLPGQFVTITTSSHVNLQICSVEIFEGFYSCLDWFRMGARKNGNYSVLNGSAKPHIVYCDLTTESNSSWTLVASFALKNVDHFRNVPYFENNPLNENSAQWELYRQSKQNMEALLSVSLQWRITCSFPVYGVDYRDYIRADKNQINPLRLHGLEVLATVEFVNVRGKYLFQSMIPFWQSSSAMFHTDSSFNSVLGQGSSPSEDNFGYYMVINPQFRCTEGEDSTTQLWFGSNH